MQPALEIVPLQYTPELWYTIGMETPTARFLWACGLFEGEGYVGGGSREGSFKLSLASSDKDVVTVFWDTIGRPGSISTTQPKYVCKSGALAKLMYAVNVSGQAAIELALRFRPYLGERRRQQIDTAMEARRRYYATRQPWGKKSGPKEGTRDACYLRPLFTGSVDEALDNPAGKQACVLSAELAPPPATIVPRDIDAVLETLSPISACLYCGLPIAVSRVVKKFCNHKCSWAHWNKRNPRAREQPADSTPARPPDTP